MRTNVDGGFRKAEAPRHTDQTAAAGTFTMSATGAVGVAESGRVARPDDRKGVNASRGFRTTPFAGRATLPKLTCSVWMKRESTRVTGALPPRSGASRKSGPNRSLAELGTEGKLRQTNESIEGENRGRS